MQQTLFDFDDLLDASIGSGRRVNIKRNLPKRIATVLDSERASGLFLQFVRGDIQEQEFDDGLDACIIEQGMTKEEIERYFPPAPRHKDKLSFNRTSLIGSVVWEERELVGQSRRPGNVRHFWYTNLMYTLMKVMKDTNNNSIDSSYGQVLTDLVIYEGFRYSDINLTSNKSKLCEALFENSPYPNVIIACEKESYHEHLKRLASIFRITYISLGGQGSYKVYEDLVVDLINAGIDINQEFHIFMISDFDPQGFCIQDTAREHLERSGIRKVTIHRVYLSPEHITKGIVERHAVPYVWGKKSTTGTKGALTLYNKFGARTGGIYKVADEWQRFAQNGDGSYGVPLLNQNAGSYELFRVELDNFRDEILLQLLIDALDDFMDGSEYYYQEAQKYLEDLFQEKLSRIVEQIVSKKVEDLLSEEYLTSYDLEEKLDELSSTLTSDVDELEKKMEEYYEQSHNWLEVQIDELASQITNLQGRQDDLRSRRDELRLILENLWDTKSAPLEGLRSKLRDDICEPLTSYKREVEATIKDDVTFKLRGDGFPLKEWVDFTHQRDAIFEEARKGSDQFEVELNFMNKQVLHQCFGDELTRRQEDITEDESIQMPAVPLEIDDIPQKGEEILSKMKDVEAGELTSHQMRQFRALHQLYDVGGDMLWQFWTTNDLDEFLESFNLSGGIDE